MGKPRKAFGHTSLFPDLKQSGRPHPTFTRKEGFASRRLSTSWVQPLPQVTQNFTSRTTYTFASSEPKTCLETSGLGKKKILETYTEKVSVGRFFFFSLGLVGEKKGRGGGRRLSCEILCLRMNSERMFKVMFTMILEFFPKWMFFLNISFHPLPLHTFQGKYLLSRLAVFPKFLHL